MGVRRLTDHKVLLDLLDLQAVDSEIDRLKDERQGLPELEAYKTTAQEKRALEAQEATEADELAATTSSINKAQGELELLEQKKEAEERRMFAGGFSSKELENLQHEVEMLGRQIGAREDEILAALDVREEQEARLVETRRQLELKLAQNAELETAIADKWKVIDGEISAQTERRTDIVPLIPAEMLDLYEELRAHKEGVAIGRLGEGICGGCHMALSLPEQAEAAREDPPRCTNCRRILVPQ
jgi:predicted  nucleic acid-binding Zn-ribbon protein